ncbi:MAG: chemoreceptor glutamine deamidase CheD, partial [Paucibacter sp.]|nr:chemoreceptor glutamine deamidase CheD [Roseateles sp.]
MPSSSPSAGTTFASGPGAARVAQLKAQTRKQGEASFFFYDAHFKN